MNDIEEIQVNFPDGDIGCIAYVHTWVYVDIGIYLFYIETQKLSTVLQNKKFN